MVKHSDVKLAIIACVSKNMGLGNNGELLFSIKEDMQFFKAHTLPGVVIMGRKTFESLKRPLPGRVNIIVSRNPDFNPQFPDTYVYGSFTDALEVAKAHAVIHNMPTVYAIGGTSIYEAAMYAGDVMYLTHVEAIAPADTFFPAINWLHWQPMSRTDSKNDEWEYTFATYVKKV